ncbi:DNA sulfur modification protein DndB [Oscillochloris sp. ZM17-4]|uniref:DNA sulfur modification protein DndB n=1 Tax=Oscillochloris sp. ZM17-4 TaxID=2866714 RepID=UPI001C7306BA|nr:DNA sulfur modification protein DndB [Oscillochloris sp. ZM17-4]MBX0330252.1 DNA sulfur modification protein DndB [Oscillochloris sp. ZM17-4]
MVSLNTGAYTFPALRIRQGEHHYYLIQCPLRLIPRMLLFDEAEVPASIRRAQTLDPASVTRWGQYLAAHPADYVMPPLIASVDGDLLFEPLAPEQPEIGRLRISIEARLIVRDGQHRRAAIQATLAEHSALADDSVPLMLIPDPELRRAAALYRDLHPSHARPTMSKRVLQDRGDLAALVRQLVDELPLFQGLTEIEKTTISNRSTALFTLSAIYQATQALLGVGAGDVLGDDRVALAFQFWQSLGEIVPEWRQIIGRETTASALRQAYIHSHTVTLLAIGMAGNALITAHPADWKERLTALGDVDWSRANTSLWEGRAMVRGKMSKTRDSISLTASAIKQILGLELTERERELERLVAGL